MKYIYALFIHCVFINFAIAGEISTHDGTVKFVAVGKPAMLKISGAGQELKPNLKIENQKMNGEFTFQLSSLTTGIDLRDEHMKRKYLEIEKYPVAKLKVTNIALPQPLDTISKLSLKTVGVLSLHGKEKEIPITIDLDRQDNEVLVHAKTSIQVSDYQISIPSYMGITVADNVDIDVTFPISEKK